MTNNIEGKPDIKKENGHMESPASSTIKVTTPEGFEVLLTSRDFDDRELTKKQIAHLLNLDKALKASGFTPVVRGSTFSKKAVEYVKGVKCPVCQNSLVYATTKTGKRFAKCFTNKYINGQATGCKYVAWNLDTNGLPLEQKGAESANNEDYSG